MEGWQGLGLVCPGIGCEGHVLLLLSLLLVGLAFGSATFAFVVMLVGIVVLVLSVVESGVQSTASLDALVLMILQVRLVLAWIPPLEE